MSILFLVRSFTHSFNHRFLGLIWELWPQMWISYEPHLRKPVWEETDIKPRVSWMLMRKCWALWEPQGALHPVWGQGLGRGQKRSSESYEERHEGYPWQREAFWQSLSSVKVGCL